MKKKSKLYNGFFKNGKVLDCPVYDAHCHMGDWSSVYLPCPDPESMLKQMNRAGIKMIFFCHHSALHLPDISNRDNIRIKINFILPPFKIF